MVPNRFLEQLVQDQNNLCESQYTTNEITIKKSSEFEPLHIQFNWHSNFQQLASFVFTHCVYGHIVFIYIWIFIYIYVTTIHMCTLKYVKWLFVSINWHNCLFKLFLVMWIMSHVNRIIVFITILRWFWFFELWIGPRMLFWQPNIDMELCHFNLLWFYG